ncbi:MAG TPA: response regulator transcription factor [Solirubrobacteraceae bacterium]|nr:response regulator transcription factor [Solirubrobacteraceae bacterium]
MVESDRRVGAAMTEQLIADGFSVELARSAEHARVLARVSAPALAVLGRLDAPLGALELLREIRTSSDTGAAWERTLPAIVMSAHARETDVLRAFEAGADDFLARDTGYLELRARMRAILRRSADPESVTRTIEIGSLVIDTDAHVTTVDGRELSLRRMEFELLVALAREPQRVFTKAELLSTVWGYRADGSSRTVDSHASRLRRKLAPDGGRRWVISVWGVGYRLI